MHAGADITPIAAAVFECADNCARIEFVATSDVLETGSMAKRERRSFTPEHKAEVVGLIRSSGRTVHQCAKCARDKIVGVARELECDVIAFRVEWRDGGDGFTVLAGGT